MTRDQKYVADQKVERVCAQFLDDNLYKKTGKPFQRYDDKQHQFAGVDLQWGNLRVDEKVKYKGCVNQLLKCPSFEMSLVDRGGSVRDGWFTSSQSETDAYCFINVFGSCTDRCMQYDKIDKLNVMFVLKSSVEDFIKRSMSLEDLKSDAKRFRETEDGKLQFDDRVRKRYPSDFGFWLTYSLYPPERPINLVMTRETLKTLRGTVELEVSREGVKKIA